MRRYEALYTLSVVGVARDVTPRTRKLHSEHRRWNYARKPAPKRRKRQKFVSEAPPAKTGSRTMAETTAVTSRTPISYSTVYTLGVYHHHHHFILPKNKNIIFNYTIEIQLAGRQKNIKFMKLAPFKKACNRRMTFKVVQGHCRCCHLIGNIRFPINLPL